MGSLTIGSVLIGSFIACAVEVTEMVIIVVGVGTTRGWRSTLVGAGCGLLVLVAVIAGLGQALSLVPINPLRVAIGGLLLTFGLQWLSKGVIGVAADGFTGGEEDEEVSAGGPSGGAIDWTAWLLAFKGVTLEGLEVAFIVIAFGAGSRGGHGGYLDAFVGAAAAFLVVGTAGALSINRVKKVPGRTLKFGVGGLISTFGTFWAMEGLGVKWPGARLSLAWLYAAYLGLTFLLALLARRGVLGPEPFPTVLGDTGPEGPLGVAPASARSVSLFQRERALPVTGDIDPPTRAAIKAEAFERSVSREDWGAVGVDVSTRTAVEDLQRRLGLDVTGTVDAATRGALRVLQAPGVFDPADPAQLTRFQATHDLPVTGRLDDLTRAAARAVLAEAGASEATRKADRASGEASGYDGGAAAGGIPAAAERFDAGDPETVRRLQRLLHLEEDGIVGEETRGALRALAGLADVVGLRPSWVADGDGDGQGIDPTDAQSVRRLQRDYDLLVDGVIGPQTRRALLWRREHLLDVDVSSSESVRAFQRRHGLVADGVVGPATQAAMLATRMARQPDDIHPKDRYGPAAESGAGFGVGMDPADAESVRSFQRRHGLEPDGEIGPRTQAVLRALRAERRRGRRDEATR